MGCNFSLPVGTSLSQLPDTGPRNQAFSNQNRDMDSLKNYLREFRNGKQVAKQIPEKITTVLLGESTHGTEEYYRIRAEISKYLIEFQGYKVILCEADWTFMWHVNQYIHRKKSRMFPERVRFPKWMWKNQPFYDLVEWMRKRASFDGPYIFGLDCYCKEESKLEVLKFFDFHDREGLGKLFRQACYPKEKPDMWESVLAKLQWEIKEDDKHVKGKDRRGVLLGSEKFRGCSKLDQYNAEQNLECMMAAVEYYTRQKLDPPGSNASWNARDQHMMTTMLRLKSHSKQLFGIKSEDLKMIAWAHNSHVGDATASPSGGEAFDNNEMWNLGQMCRRTFNNVFVVGFHTYHGQVRAAKSWGSPGMVMDLKESIPYSFGHTMHTWFSGKSMCVALYKLKDPKNWEYKPGSFKLDTEYQVLHTEVYLTPDMALRKDNRNRINMDPSKSFIAVKRKWFGQHFLRLQIRDYDGTSKYDGWWLTEYQTMGSISINCLPVTLLKSACTSSPTVNDLKTLANFSILQRLVGVNYRPLTELRSHYTEVRMASCYDLAVFVDRTHALDVDLVTPLTLQEHLANETKENEMAMHVEDEKPKSSDVDIKIEEKKEDLPSSDRNIKTGKLSKKSQELPKKTLVIPKKLNRRLLREYKSIRKNPIEFIETQPLETNILEWHFVITGNADPYTKGKYHGILEFPDNFPMKPPSIKMLTPSGRFEINKRICLSMSDFHKELWNPSWTVEKILIGLMSFMYEDSRESIGSILDTRANRRKYAAASPYFNAQNEIYVELFMTPDEDEQKENFLNLLLQGSGNSQSDKACRYCLSDNGELIMPCQCKGSNAYVHLGCLRVWQKSVILTQSTHPRYQNNINEVCNVCEQPFKDEYKPPTRHQSMLEYTGNEIPTLVVSGNMIVSTRVEAEANDDRAKLLRQHPNLLSQENHFTKCVYLIAIASSNPRERGGGSVLAVNLVRPIQTPLKIAVQRLPGILASPTSSPLNKWKQFYLPQLKQLSCIIGPIEHHLGGPVRPSEAFVILEVPSEFSRSMRRFHIKNNIYFGALEMITKYLKQVFGVVNGKLSGSVTKEDFLKFVGNKGLQLKIFWGYGAWNVTQLLGEIARRSMGLVISHPNLAFDNWRENSAWERVVDNSIIAKTEFAQY